MGSPAVPLFPPEAAAPLAESPREVLESAPAPGSDLCLSPIRQGANKGKFCQLKAGHGGHHRAQADKRATSAARTPPAGDGGMARRQNRPAATKAVRSPLPSLWAALVFDPIGMALEHGMAAPVIPAAEVPGRVIQFAAIDSGERAHRLASRYAWYRALSTASAKDGPWSDLFAIVLPPVMSAIMAADPELRMMLAPMFAAAMRPAVNARIRAEAEMESVGEAISEADARAAEMAARFEAILFGDTPPGPGGHDGGAEQ